MTMNKSLNILIATGIYPPALGGPAKYGENMGIEWGKAGHKVWIKTYTKVEHALPSDIRHLYYFLKIIPAVIWSDFIFALDTFSVGWPATCAAKIFGKKIIMRTGGDFLWEGYVERTGDLVLLRNFYDTTRYNWSRKEKFIFKLTKWTLRNVSILIFSTKWQRDIWMKPYNLANIKTEIIENYYGEKIQSSDPTEKNFIAGTRKLKWKNIQVLKEVFEGISGTFFKDISGVSLDLNNYPHEEFMKKISEYYATILVSLGDISPNMILESIRLNKPFIVTEENGLMDRIGSIAITADPKSPQDIREKVLWLCKKENYEAQVQKIKNFNFRHSWEEIAQEIVGK